MALETRDEDALQAHRTAVAAAASDRDAAAAGFTLSDAQRLGRGRAGAPAGNPVTLTAAEFPANILAAGFNPTLTASLSPALQGNAPQTAERPMALRKGKTAVAVTDLDLRTTRYQVRFASCYPYFNSAISTFFFHSQTTPSTPST